MESGNGSGGTPPGVWDPLIVELASLRRSVGDPSYAEITRRIAERRMADGVSEHAARIARSTVFDAFRMGRSRVNLPLVREIVQALDGDGSLVDGWVAACQPSTAVPRDDDPHPLGRRPTLRQTLVLMVACVAFNMVGRELVDLLHLPIYLDMWGTAIAAIALGPWLGATVGGTTNVVGVVGSGWVSLPFSLVNMAGALVWGYGVRRYGMGRTLPRFLALNVAVALTCTIIAVPILSAYGWSVGQGQDSVTATLQDLTHRLGLAVGLSNVLTSMGDKLLTGFVALVAISMLPLSIRAASRLVLAAHPDDPRRAAGTGADGGVTVG
ncbi:MAG: hypothetical protein ABWX74_06300 [Aeromicrobium sp.]